MHDHQSSMNVRHEGKYMDNGDPSSGHLPCPLNKNRDSPLVEIDDGNSLISVVGKKGGDGWTSSGGNDATGVGGWVIPV